MSQFKRMKTGDEEEVVGFVTRLSPMKVPTTPGKKAYFDGILETSPNKTARIVGWSPDRRLKLKEHQLNKVPIKFNIFKGRKEVLSDGSTRYKIGDFQKIEGTTADFEPQLADFEVLDLDEELHHKTINSDYKISAKVLYKEGSTKLSQNCNIILGRGQKSIVLGVPKSSAVKIVVGHSYEFCPVTILATLRLAATLNTAIEQVDGVPCSVTTADAEKLLKQNEISCRCVGVVRCESAYLCPSCNRPIRKEEDRESDIIECRECGAATLVEGTVEQINVFANFKTESTGEVLQFQLDGDVLTSIDILKKEQLNDKVAVLRALVKTGTLCVNVDENNNVTSATPKRNPEPNFDVLENKNTTLTTPKRNPDPKKCGPMKKTK